MPISKRLPIAPQSFPPFQGFPPEGLALLQKLKQKKFNTREWFAKKKEDYQTLLKFPMQCLISDLHQTLSLDFPEFAFSPGTALFRPYRDTRFHPDTPPIKTSIAAAFDLAGHPNATADPNSQPAGLYLHIEPGNILAGGGLWQPTSTQLKKIRSAILTDPKPFTDCLNAPAFRKSFDILKGDKLIRPPKGIADHHPLLPYLKLKQFIVSRSYIDASSQSPKFLKAVAETYLAIKPLIRWLNTTLGYL